MKPRSDRSPLLFEKDGDFNPGWLLFIVFAALGAGISVGCFVVALENDKAWPALIAALSFVAFAMLVTAMIVVPIARAKLLAPALPAAAKGISAAAQSAGGWGDCWTDNETGDPEPVRNYRE